MRRAPCLLLRQLTPLKEEDVETSVEAYMKRLLGHEDAPAEQPVVVEEQKEETFVPELNEEPMKLLTAKRIQTFCGSP